MLNITDRELEALLQTGTVEQLADISDRIVDQIRAINMQLIDPNRCGEDGRRLDNHAYWDWRKRALVAKLSKEEQQRRLKARLHALREAEFEQRARERPKREGIFVPLWDGMTRESFLEQAAALYERLSRET